uniref:Uncharacterized protein n=1 Tax=Panagrolaimus sp. PS1159 TaxID=55785 RepID=A0AC35EZV3_9BILA
MKLYQKLIQTCKYFFIKNPIIILHCLRFEEHVWRICDKINCKEYHTYRKIDLAKIQSTISVSKNLEISFIFSLNSSIASSLIPKLYNGNVEALELHGQNISFNDLLFFSKTIQQIDLQKSTVFYQNGIIVPHEIIVANLPKLLCFKCDSNANYDFSNTVTELLKIQNFKNLKFFFLYGLNESFDMETFFKQYLKKNIQTVFCFEYFDNVPLSDEYKEKLQNITDEVLAAELPLFVFFDGQDRAYELMNLLEIF